MIAMHNKPFCMAVLYNWYTVLVKIITLNTWGGRAGKEQLLAFIKQQCDVDVFCLQEMWSDEYHDLIDGIAGGVKVEYEKILVHGVQEVSKLLGDHTPFFRPHNKDNYGLLTLVKNELEIVKEGEVFVHKFKEFVPEGDVGLHARNVQYIQTNYNNKTLTILNFHGLWNGKGKTDSEDRIMQSEKIVAFLKTLQGEIIFCGDFNLLPNTQSIKILENYGLRNLVREYNITSTRTSFYTKNEKYADYIFVTKGLTVKDFKVLQDEVSDHAPLYLEIE